MNSLLGRWEGRGCIPRLDITNLSLACSNQHAQTQLKCFFWKWITHIFLYTISADNTFIAQITLQQSELCILTRQTWLCNCRKVTLMGVISVKLYVIVKVPMKYLKIRHVLSKFVSKPSTFKARHSIYIWHSQFNDPCHELRLNKFPISFCFSELEA
jgi:hypothetical protein